jgi:hypothetical protein
MDTTQEMIRIATGKLQLATIKRVIENFNSEAIKHKEDNPDWPEVNTTLLPSGALRINLFLAYSIEIEAWRNGLNVWILTHESKQKLQKDLQLQLLNFGSVVDNSPDYHAFINTIPENIREAVKPFQINQLSMLQWIAKDSRAEDLVIHNPLLLWLIVGNDQYQPQSKNILAHKQHEILGHLDYPPKKTSIRWLKSLQQDTWDIYTLQNIVSCLGAAQVIERLRKLPNSTPEIGAVLASYPEILDTRIPENMDHLLNNGQLLKKFHNTRMYFRDILRISQLLDIQDIHTRIRQCQSMDAVKILHDQLSRQYTSRQDLTKRKEIFPDGPLKEDESFQQIRSTYDLFEEGRTMHHCVASYASRAKTGFRFFYRILAPERLTLEIKANETSIVVLQCSGVCNESPHKDSIKFIKQWLLENSGDRKVTFSRHYS